MAVVNLVEEPEVDALVLSVRSLEKIYSRWLRQDKDDDFPPALVKAIGVVCALVTSSFPKDDRLMSLFMACTQLAGAFQDVLNEEPGSARRCIAAIQNVVKFLEAHETEVSVPIQSVASMLKEYANQSLRYTWVARAYGDYDADTDVWHGPFFSCSGVPLQAVIEKEAASPGSVLGSDYQPLGNRRKQARIKAEAMRQLSSLQAGLFRPEGGAVPEKASVVEMLAEGQYPDVIARVKGVTLASVLESARVAGIKVGNRDDDLNRAANELLTDPMAESKGYVKPPFDEPSDDLPDDDDEVADDEPEDDEPEPDEVEASDDEVANEVQSDLGKLTSEELTDFVVGYMAEFPGATAHEILAAAVTDTGKSASRQLLAPILKTLKGA